MMDLQICKDVEKRLLNVFQINVNLKEGDEKLKVQVLGNLLYVYDSSWYLPTVPILVGGHSTKSSSAGDPKLTKQCLAQLRSWCNWAGVGYLVPKGTSLADPKKYLQLISTLMNKIDLTFGLVKLSSTVRQIAQRQHRQVVKDKFQKQPPELGNLSSISGVTVVSSVAGGGKENETTCTPNKSGVSSGNATFSIPSGRQLPRTPNNLPPGIGVSSARTPSNSIVVYPSGSGKKPSSAARAIQNRGGSDSPEVVGIGLGAPKTPSPSPSSQSMPPPAGAKQPGISNNVIPSGIQLPRTPSVSQVKVAPTSAAASGSGGNKEDEIMEVNADGSPKKTTPAKQVIEFGKKKSPPKNEEVVAKNSLITVAKVTSSPAAVMTSSSSSSRLNKLTPPPSARKASLPAGLSKEPEVIDVDEKEPPLDPSKIVAKYVIIAKQPSSAQKSAKQQLVELKNISPSKDKSAAAPPQVSKLSNLNISVTRTPTKSTSGQKVSPLQQKKASDVTTVTDSGGDVIDLDWDSQNTIPAKSNNPSSSSARSTVGSTPPGAKNQSNAMKPPAAATAPVVDKPPTNSKTAQDQPVTPVAAKKAAELPPQPVKTPLQQVQGVQKPVTTPAAAAAANARRLSYQNSFESFMNKDWEKKRTENIKPEPKVDPKPKPAAAPPVNSPRTFEEFVAAQLEKEKKMRQLDIEDGEEVSKTEEKLATIDPENFPPKKKKPGRPIGWRLADWQAKQSTSANSSKNTSSKAAADPPGGAKKQRGRRKKSETGAAETAAAPAVVADKPVDRVKLSPIKPRKRKPIKDFIDEDFDDVSDNEWAADQARREREKKVKLSPIKPRKRKPIKDLFNDDFSDDNWSADQADEEEDYEAVDRAAAAAAPVVEKRMPRRQAASRSQIFMKEMAESLAKENYEDGDDEEEEEEIVQQKQLEPVAQALAEEEEPDFEEEREFELRLEDDEMDSSEEEEKEEKPLAKKRSPIKKKSPSKSPAKPVAATAGKLSNADQEGSSENGLPDSSIAFSIAFEMPSVTEPQQAAAPPPPPTAQKSAATTTTKKAEPPKKRGRKPKNAAKVEVPPAAAPHQPVASKPCDNTTAQAADPTAGIGGGERSARRKRKPLEFFDCGDDYDDDEGVIACNDGDDEESESLAAKGGRYTKSKNSANSKKRLVLKNTSSDTAKKPALPAIAQEAEDPQPVRPNSSAQSTDSGSNLTVPVPMASAAVKEPQEDAPVIKKKRGRAKKNQPQQQQPVNPPQPTDFQAAFQASFAASRADDQPTAAATDSCSNSVVSAFSSVAEEVSRPSSVISEAQSTESDDLKSKKKGGGRKRAAAKNSRKLTAISMVDGQDDTSSVTSQATTIQDGDVVAAAAAAAAQPPQLSDTAVKKKPGRRKRTAAATEGDTSNQQPQLQQEQQPTALPDNVQEDSSQTKPKSAAPAQQPPPSKLADDVYATPHPNKAAAAAASTGGARRGRKPKNSTASAGASIPATTNTKGILNPQVQDEVFAAANQTNPKQKVEKQGSRSKRSIKEVSYLDDAVYETPKPTRRRK